MAWVERLVKGLSACLCVCFAIVMADSALPIRFTNGYLIKQRVGDFRINKKRSCQLTGAFLVYPKKSGRLGII